MKATAIVGVLLIVLGLFALAYQGIRYTDRETVIDLGPIQAQTTETKTIPLPPILGAGALAAGVILLLASARRHA